MMGLGIIAGVFAFLTLCGLVSFAVASQDVAPSQSTWIFPWAIPLGVLGLIVCGAWAGVAWWLS